MRKVALLNTFFSYARQIIVMIEQLVFISADEFTQFNHVSCKTNSNPIN